MEFLAILLAYLLEIISSKEGAKVVGGQLQTTQTSHMSRRIYQVTFVGSSLSKYYIRSPSLPLPSTEFSRKLYLEIISYPVRVNEATGLGTRQPREVNASIENPQPLTHQFCLLNHTILTS